MLRTIYHITILLLSLICGSRAEAQVFDWVKQNNTFLLNDHGTTIAYDSEGNVYTTGNYNDSLVWGDSVVLRGVSRMAYVLKTDGTGKTVWAKNLGYASSGFPQAQGYAITVDLSGNVYSVGMYVGLMDFDPGPGLAVDTAKGVWDAYISKLDKNGNYVWGRTIGSATGSECADMVRTDNSGNVIISGYFSGTLDLNPGAGVNNVTAVASTDRFIVKFDQNGNFMWGNHFDRGANIFEIGGLAVDPAGNSYIVGSFFNTMSFPASFGIPALNAVRYYDMFIIKFDPQGNFIWVKKFGGSGDGDFAYDIIADDQYNLYVVGNFNGIATLDPSGKNMQTFTPTPNAQYPTLYYDAFVLKIDTSGSFIWANTFGSDNHDNGLKGALDKKGNVYVTGSYKNTIKLTRDNGQIDSVKSNGGYNVYLIKFDPNGKYQWSKTFGSAGDNSVINTGPDRGSDLLVDNGGNIYLSGNFKLKVDFDPPNKVELTAMITTSNFLIRYACNDTSSIIVEESSCGEFTFNGILYNESGHYTQILPNAFGCDSTVHLYLTISEIATPIITVDGFTLGTLDDYATYQWLLDGAPIPGATNRTYEVKGDGEYAVIVTNNISCADTSNGYIVNNYGTGIKNNSELAKEIRIYPNPARYTIHIQSPEPVHVSLNSIDGKQLIQQSNSGTISVQNLAPGLYIIQITDQNHQLIRTEKIIKE